MDNGYFVSGTTTSFGDGSEDSLALKLDESGNIQWQRIFGGPAQDFGFSVAEVRDGGYVIAGWVNESSTFVIKFDEGGNVVWKKEYGSGDREIFYSMEVPREGGLIMAGLTASYGAGLDDAWIVKTDENGYVSDTCPEGMIRDSTIGVSISDLSRTPISVVAAEQNGSLVDFEIMMSATSASVGTQCGL